jgi:hypothetical protein
MKRIYSFDVAPNSAIVALIFPLLVLGPLFPVLPISFDAIDFVVRLSIMATLLCIGVAWFSKTRGIKTMIFAISLFAAMSCVGPMIAKGYNSTLFSIILAGGLGFLSFHYFRFPNAIIVVFAIITAYCLRYFLIEGDLDGVFYHFINGDLVGNSRNFVGILLLQYYLFYYAVCVVNQIKPKIWPVYIMPILGVMSGGVSSTLVSTALLFGHLQSSLKVSKVYVILSLVIIWMAYVLGFDWLQETIFGERIASDSYTASRILLWTDFFSQLSLWQFLVGFPNTADFIDHEINLEGIRNLHNSYLNLFRDIGVFSSLYYCLIGYIAVALFRVDSMLFMIYCATLARAGTDGYYFSSFLVDFIIFYLFMLTPVGERFVLEMKTTIGSSSIAHGRVRTVQ